ncbi:MAG: PssE/Cps14G family polysaccharide biosynthesis glycosyltransferase [Paraclostridium sordellii]
MIFVTLGSQKFQFNRLLKEIDRLIEEKKITEEVFVQIGYSDYKPKNYRYKEFLDREEFSEIMSKCDKVITHGGTGAIITAVKNGKKVIAIPRLKEFNEHVDNHQLQIIDEFKKMGYIQAIKDIDELEIMILSMLKFKNKIYISNTLNIMKCIDDFIRKV